MAKHNGDKTEVRIDGVSKTIGEQLHNIADHKGMTRNQFLKSELYNIVEKQPEHMKQPVPKD